MSGPQLPVLLVAVWALSGSVGHTGMGAVADAAMLYLQRRIAFHFQSHVA